MDLHKLLSDNLFPVDVVLHLAVFYSDQLAVLCSNILQNI